jgi:catechol 2,3-dioxygenase-like lactoylglutathione lyase family enzyme
MIPNSPGVEGEAMRGLEHVAVASNTEEQADAFFGKLLGMEKTRTFTIPAEIMDELFGAEGEVRVVRYAGDALDAEVFITGDDSRVADRFTHLCLTVDDREALAARAESMGFSVKRARKKGGDGYVLFVEDFFGNRYEIK